MANIRMTDSVTFNRNNDRPSSALAPPPNE